MDTLDANQNRMLAALTIAAARELAGDTVLLDEGDRFGSDARMARVEDIVLIDHPARKEAPRLICVYRVDLLDMGAGKKFKFEPECMLFAYERLHKAEPAEFRLVLMQAPAAWFDYVTTRLLAALNRERPHLFEPRVSAAP